MPGVGPGTVLYMAHVIEEERPGKRIPGPKRSSDRVD